MDLNKSINNQQAITKKKTIFEERRTMFWSKLSLWTQVITLRRAKFRSLTPDRARYLMRLARKRVQNWGTNVLELSGHQVSQILEQQGNSKKQWSFADAKSDAECRWGKIMPSNILQTNSKREADVLAKDERPRLCFWPLPSEQFSTCQKTSKTLWESIKHKNSNTGFMFHQ